MNSKKSFRNIEMPENMLENILLIPAEQGPCHFAPIIKVERKLSCEQVKEMMAYEEAKYRGLYQSLGLEVASLVEMPTFKQCLIRKDLYLLSEVVATDYYSRIRKQNPDWDNLYQMVEIDWALTDFNPGEQCIHYEIFTKREILIR